jgi:hypothetical protein
MTKRILGITAAAFSAASLLALTLLEARMRIPAQGGEAKPGPVEIQALYQGISTPQQRAARSAAAPAPAPHVQFLGRHLPPFAALGAKINQRDVVLQEAYGALVVTTEGLDFAGLGEDFPGYSICCAPPDTNASVGTSQVVETVNLSYVVFDKGTGAVASGGGPFALTSLFSSFSNTSCGGAPGTTTSDPVVKFDQLAGRWVISFIAFIIDALGNFSPPFLQCIAVSQTADATSSYNAYVFDLSTLNGLLSAPALNDYDKLGMWPDGYYMSFNEFTATAFVGVGACAFDRASMIAGNPSSAVCFLTSSSQFSLLPSDLDGSSSAPGTTATPPPGSPNFYIGNLDGLSGFDLWKFRVDFTTPANSTFIGPSHLTASAYSLPCGGGAGPCVPQPGTSDVLDTLGDRLMFRNAYRNFLGSLGGHESMVVSHSIAQTGGVCGVAVRWYEIQSPDTTPAIYQQGTFSPDASCRWMPSIGMDRRGDIALGYSVSDGISVDPSIRYTGRTAIDPLGIMESEKSIIAGTGTQSDTVDRWGDYSSIAIDPTDDCTFWYAQEYMKVPGSFVWSTRLASFRFSPVCGGAVILVRPVELNFPPQPLFTSSAPQPVVLSNVGGLPAPIVSITTSAEFAQTNNCGASLPAGGQCTVRVTFMPTRLGWETGFLSLDYQAAGVQSVKLFGFGEQPL